MIRLSDLFAVLRDDDYPCTRRPVDQEIDRLDAQSKSHRVKRGDAE